MTNEQQELYNRTVKRLNRIGIKDPTAQIVALAEEIEHYRDELRRIEAYHWRKGAVCHTVWGRNLDALVMGALGDPSNPETLLRYWRMQEAAGYPYASENVKYFEEVLKK